MIKDVEKKKQFKTRVIDWSQRLGILPKQIRMQKMTRKWASCSTQGWISFSHDLLKEPRDFQDEVIVHELIHIKVPNHGRLFKLLFRIHISNSSQQFSACSKYEIIK